MEETKPPVTPTPAAGPPRGGTPAPSGPKKITLDQLLRQKMAAGLSREQALEVIEAQRREDPKSIPEGKISPIGSVPAKLHPEVQKRVAAGLTLEQAQQVVEAQKAEDAARAKKTK